MGVGEQFGVRVIAVLLLICLGVPFLTCFRGCAKYEQSCFEKCLEDHERDPAKIPICVAVCGSASSKCKNTCVNNAHPG